MPILALLILFAALLAALFGSGEPRIAGFSVRQGRGAESARLHVCLGQMPDRAMVAMLGGETPEDSRLDLCSEKRPWLAHKLCAETSYAMDRLLNDPGATLSALANFLRDVGEKLTGLGN